MGRLRIYIKYLFFARRLIMGASITMVDGGRGGQKG